MIPRCGIVSGTAALLPATPASGRCRVEQVRTGLLMKGTPYETPYFVKSGDRPGPTIVVIGGLHGDEPAGYLAARMLRKWRVVRGKLVIVPEAHREAIRRRVRAYPGNMNNLFPGRPDGNAMERLAHEIFQVIRKARPSVLLTLHESVDFYVDDPKRYGQTFCFDFPELSPLMKRALDATNRSISQRKHRFVLLVDAYPNCPTYQAWVRLRTPATSIETCRRLPLSVRVAYQLRAVAAFCDVSGLVYRRGTEQASRSAASLTRHEITSPLCTRPW